MGLDIIALLRYAAEAGGSDLHISAGAPVMVRVAGELRPLAISGATRLLEPDAEAARTLIYDALTDTQKRRLEADKELDFALSLDRGPRFRGNVFLQHRGVAAVFRAISATILSLDELGLPQGGRAFASLDRGLVLVTGPTGSGKTTTLAAFIDAVNQERHQHIVTLEDPIEILHAPRACMVNQREVGSHTHSFGAALRSALREDPDVILVGEMRDPETIKLALTAAETGHLVFSTLHTSNAAQTIERIVNAFAAGEQPQVRAALSYSLAGVIAQRLLPRRGGGRIGVYEVLTATPGVRALIRDGKTAQLPGVIQTSRRQGMISLPQSFEALVEQGAFEAHDIEALRHLVNADARL